MGSRFDDVSVFILKVYLKILRGDNMCKKICPLPTKWNNIYNLLLEHYKNLASIPKPPIPLILNGWVFSNDEEKHARWLQTMQWIKEYYPDSQILILNEDEWYYGN